MRFSVATVLAFAAAVIADVTEDFDSIYTPKAGSTIEAGKEFEVKWNVPEKYAHDKVTIILIGGASALTQVPLGKPIAVEVDNGAKSYKWQVASDLGDETIYGLQFKLESNGEIYQYSPPFHIKKAEGSSSETGSSTVTVTTSQGAKTITLSSTPVPTTTHHNTTTKAHNSTSYVKPTTSKIVTTTPTDAATTTAPAETSSSSAAAATMVAAAGGLLVALLAL